MSIPLGSLSCAAPSLAGGLVFFFEFTFHFLILYFSNISISTFPMKSNLNRPMYCNFHNFYQVELKFKFCIRRIFYFSKRLIPFSTLSSFHFSALGALVHSQNASARQSMAPRLPSFAKSGLHLCTGKKSGPLCSENS